MFGFNPSLRSNIETPVDGINGGALGRFLNGCCGGGGIPPFEFKGASCTSVINAMGIGVGSMCAPESLRRSSALLRLNDRWKAIAAQMIATSPSVPEIAPAIAGILQGRNQGQFSGPRSNERMALPHTRGWRCGEARQGQLTCHFWLHRQPEEVW
jgi:hypothetical protein